MGSGTVTYSQLGNMGRLGNSMFQICATLAYAMEHNKLFVFPEWKYSKYMNQPLPAGTVPNAFRYNETTFHYTPIPFFNGNVDLSGYYQSALYFEKHLSEILPYITLNDHYFRYITNKYGYYLNQKTCSIHVRHGDYLNNPTTSNYHGVLAKEYYERAIYNIYGDKHEEVLFIITSDDLDWCIDNFNLPNQLFVDGEEDVIDLFIGSYCRNHIIANSSFSWWQTFLNRNQNKRTVAPNQWFYGKDAPRITKDLYRKDWTVI